MNKPKKEIQRKIHIMKKIEKDGRGLIVPKRIDFFKFSLPYYRYYGIRIINYSNITKDFKKLGKHRY